MKYSPKLLSAALSCSVIGFSNVCLADEASVRKELTAAYAQISKALTTGDIITFEKFLSSDYTGKSLGGKNRNRKEVLAGIKETMKRVPPNAKLSISIDKLTLKGNKAVTMVSLGTSNISEDGQGNSHIQQMIQKDRQSWSKSGGSWKLKHSDILSQKMTLDGKTVK